MDRWIDRAVSITPGAYDASARSTRSTKFCFSIIGSCLGKVWIVLERFASVWDRLGTDKNVLGKCWFSSKCSSYYAYLWGSYGVGKHPIYMYIICMFIYDII